MTLNPRFGSNLYTTSFHLSVIRIPHLRPKTRKDELGYLFSTHSLIIPVSGQDPECTTTYVYVEIVSGKSFRNGIHMRIPSQGFRTMTIAKPVFLSNSSHPLRDVTSYKSL